MADEVRFRTAVVAVRDLATSTAFYADVVGLRLERSSATFSYFTGGLELYDAGALATATGVEGAATGPMGHGNLALYLEAADVDAAYARASHVAQVLHPPRTEPWGQRLFRIADPDGHVIEIGSPLA